MKKEEDNGRKEKSVITIEMTNGDIIKAELYPDVV